MPDSEKIIDPTATSPRRQWPRFWLILTGLLVLLNLITLAVGKYQQGQTLQKMKQANVAHAQALQAMQAEYDGKLTALLTQEGKTLARAVQMVNPQLLTDQGQKKALNYFQGLLEDQHIEFIALFDANGTICATTNLRLVGKATVPAGLTDAVVSKNGNYGADVQFFGPITSSNGQSVGTVLIGMNFDAAKAVKTARPDAVAPESEGTAMPPTEDTPPE